MQFDAHMFFSMRVKPPTIEVNVHVFLLPGCKWESWVREHSKVNASKTWRLFESVFPKRQYMCFKLELRSYTRMAASKKLESRNPKLQEFIGFCGPEPAIQDKHQGNQKGKYTPPPNATGAITSPAFSKTKVCLFLGGVGSIAWVFHLL